MTDARDAVVRTALAIHDDVRTHRAQLLEQLTLGCQDEPERMAQVIVTLAAMLPADEKLLVMTPTKVWAIVTRNGFHR